MSLGHLSGQDHPRVQWPPVPGGESDHRQPIFSLFPEQGTPRLSRQVGLSAAWVRVTVSVSTSNPEACDPPLPPGRSHSLVLAQEAGLPGFSDWKVADGSQKTEEASPPSCLRCQGFFPSCSRHLKSFFCLRAKCFMLSHSSFSFSVELDFFNRKRKPLGVEKKDLLWLPSARPALPRLPQAWTEQVGVWAPGLGEGAQILLLASTGTLSTFL